MTKFLMIAVSAPTGGLANAPAGQAQLNLPAMIIGACMMLIAQIIIALLSHYLRKGSDERNVRRQELLKRAGDLSSNLYSMLSCCDIYLKRCKDHPEPLDDSDPNRTVVNGSLERWLQRVKQHRDTLDRLIGEIRFLIWDDEQVVEQGLRLVTKFAAWISLYRYRAESGLERLEAADALRKEIESVLVKIYRDGVSPSNTDCSKIRAAMWKLKPEGASGSEDLRDVIVGIDFLVPSSIAQKYIEKYASDEEGRFVEGKRFSMYQAMINAIADKASSF